MRISGAPVAEGNQMNREQVLNTLRTHKPVLAERFGVTDLALFGSFARDQATDESDVDILVRFKRPPWLASILRGTILPGRSVG